MTTTMLYRPADEPNPDTWGLPLETCIVPDEAVEAALAKGWVRHPSDLETSVEASEAPPKRKGRPPKEG